MTTEQVGQQWRVVVRKLKEGEFREAVPRKVLYSDQKMAEAAASRFSVEEGELHIPGGEKRLTLMPLGDLFEVRLVEANGRCIPVDGVAEARAPALVKVAQMSFSLKIPAIPLRVWRSPPTSWKTAP